jgi:uncharacterized delta-60 repeat protein
VQLADTLAGDVAVDANNNLLVATNDNLSRYTATGDLDTSFGTGGTATNPSGLKTSTIEVAGDGKILVGGSGVQPDAGLVLARFNADGTLDNTFSGDGNFLIDLSAGTTPSDQRVTDIAILSNDKILAFGNTGLKVSAIRLQTDGTLDSTFGDAGVASEDYGTFNTTMKMFLDSSGRIYLTSFGAVSSRLTPDGQYDAEYGIVMGGRDSILGAGIGILDNRLIVGGSTGHDAIFVGRLIEDNGVPSPMRIDNRTLLVEGAGSDDNIYAEDTATTVTTRLNAFLRTFHRSDFDDVSINGADGDDKIEVTFPDLSVHISGGNGRDKITGGFKNDTLDGNGGRDFIDGRDGADLITGGGGKDQLRGQGGNDRIHGGKGNDYLGGGGGDDRMRGDEGEDLLIGNRGGDQFFTDDAETDSLFGDGGNDTATVDSEDVLTSIEILV